MSADKRNSLEKVSLAIVGATGIVGQEILALLAAEPFESGIIQLSASDDSVGEFYEFRGAELEVVAPDRLKLAAPTLVVLCAPKDVSEALLASLQPQSLAVVDCSGLDREGNNLELMPEALVARSKAQAFSIKSACGFMVSSFLNALELGKEVGTLTATSLEPVSGAGRAGLDELWNQTRSIFNQTPCDPEFFPEQIAYNIIPHVDVMRSDGSTAYEGRVLEELASAQIIPKAASVTALRVPTMYGSGVSLTFETSKAFTSEQIIETLAKSPRFVFDQEAELAPSSMSVIGDDRIHVGRLRVQAKKGGVGALVSCWLVADNIKACIARPVVDLYRSVMPAI